jgi:hypothetical protein
MSEDAPAPRKKVNYVGAPAIFALEQACQHICDAFGGYGCYIVGSALERPNWRDVDVRYIMSDAQFEEVFPGAMPCWEQDARWLLLTVSISQWLSKQTGLPVDFQFQPQTHANERHSGARHAIGIRIGKRPKEKLDDPPDSIGDEDRPGIEVDRGPTAGVEKVRSLRWNRERHDTT